MLEIKATFPNGNIQNFGKPEDLYRYMNEEGYAEAKVQLSYIFDVVSVMRMTLEDIKLWIDMGGGEEVSAL